MWHDNILHTLLHKDQAPLITKKNPPSLFSPYAPLPYSWVPCLSTPFCLLPLSILARFLTSPPPFQPSLYFVFPFPLATHSSLNLILFFISVPPNSAPPLLFKRTQFLLHFSISFPFSLHFFNTFGTFSAPLYFFSPFPLLACFLPFQSITHTPPPCTLFLLHLLQVFV